MRNYQSDVTMARNRRLEGWPILRAEYEAVREVILMAAQKKAVADHHRSDYQLVINVINGKIGILKDIINIVEDIKLLLFCFSDTSWSTVIALSIEMLMN